jgi:hypothetical protein
MTSQDQDFDERIKRVRVKLGNDAPMPQRRRGNDARIDEASLILSVMLPQVALVLGALSLIAGRAIAMNYLGIEPSGHVLGVAEGALILLILVAMGLMLGRGQMLSHGALLVGASLAFLGEPLYIPAAPELMGSIYSSEYVTRVILGA